MAAPVFDVVRANYDLSKPLEAARFQHTVLKFMEAVRSNTFRGAEGVQLMDDFCTFVSSKHVWRLAQNVVPEFRSDPGPPTEDVPQSCLGHVLRRCKLPLLPAPFHDSNVLTSEETMLWDRHKKYVEYLATGGKGIHSASDSQRAEIDHVCQQVENIKALVKQGGGIPGQEGVKQSEEDEQDTT